MNTPIVFIAFNRVNTLRAVFASVSKCYDILDRPTFIFIDGPRTEEERIKTKAVVELSENFKRDHSPFLQIVARPQNLGCLKNVFDALTEVFKNYDRAIILEDDVVVSRTFLQYMDAALSKYEHDERIWCINAFRNRYLKIPHSYKYDVYLSPRNMTSGWGTWRDRFMAVERDMKSWPMFISSEQNRKKIDMCGRDVVGMLEKQYRNPSEFQSWDALCTFHMAKHSLFAIEPRYCMAKNIGFGSEGALHCKDDNVLFSKQKYYNFRPVLPSKIGLDNQIVENMKCCYGKQGLVVRILRRVQKVLVAFGPNFDNPIDI